MPSPKSIFPLLLLLATTLPFCVSAQQVENAGIDRFIDFAATLGDGQGSGALSYVHDWRFGKRRRLEAGLGARLTGAAGSNLTYTTAGPARLTRSFTTTFVIFFAGQETQNWDTLTVQRPFVSMLNLTVNLGYVFSPKWSAGFNIDLVGVSLGRKTSADLLSEGRTSIDPASRPTPFNVLLTGDHDRGSLNSEFFLKYKLSERWGVRAVYQFLFTEYTTGTLKQTASDGTQIDRFRHKANNFGVGLSYHF